MKKEKSILEIVSMAKKQALRLASLSNKEKNSLLTEIRNRVQKNRKEIASANQKDLEAASISVTKGELSQALLNRLHLTNDKIDQLSAYLDSVSKLEDPIGKVQYETKLDTGLDLKRVSCPLGVLAIIFESRPEVVIQVSALCLKSGNAVILKGGSEALHSNRILYSLISDVLKEFDLEGAVGMIETREDVSEILQYDQQIDLIIPRGSNSFVKYIQDNTRIPVLGHSSGICHLYIHKDSDLSKAVEITLDSKLDYPSACNAVETLLLDRDLEAESFKKILESLANKGVQLLGCSETIQRAKILNIKVQPAVDADWETEYGDLIVSIKTIDSIDSAIEHINRYGSHHTDSIVTENETAADIFCKRVDSGCVFHNASTRFSDGFVFGLGAEVGISTNKTHARGPVGLEGLIIYKYLLKGEGHIKAAFSGENAKPFLHSL